MSTPLVSRPARRSATPRPPVAAPAPRGAPGSRLAGQTSAAARRLAVLTHRRWALPVLVELQRGDVHPGGAKFVTLVNRLKLSRQSLCDTLDHLAEHDLVLRNPGYGHPMRPEYLLAEDGHAIAPAAARLLRRLWAGRLHAAAQRKWSLPVIYLLSRGHQRFGSLKSMLPGVTSRALAMSLKDLLGAGLVDRRMQPTFPPSCTYRLTARGRGVSGFVTRLAAAALR